MTIGRAIANFFIYNRDMQARWLVRLGVSPNVLTLSGTLLTVLAGVCLALGAGANFAWTLDPHLPTIHAAGPDEYHPNAWPLVAGILLYLCAAGDMLDGAVARIGKQATTFGAFLDSTLDRVSDFAIFLGIAFYFTVRGNVTHALLPFLCVFWGMMISYTRARAEDLIEFCTVGYWQRGERIAAVLISAFAFNIPALLWQQAISPAFTVWTRIDFTRKVAAGRTVETDPRKTGWWVDRLRLWRYPRMTWPYDVVTGLNIAFLIFAPIPASFDPVGRALGLH